MNFFRTSINDDVWTIYIVDDNDIVIADENEAATTQFHDREIYFRYGHIDETVVKHELYHVYFGYTCTADADLTLDQMEEVGAALFAQRAGTMLTKAVEIHNTLQELKKTMEPEDASED